ncbi:MAG: nicotinamide riboside transporter PnuC [Pseudomonadota bacterium]
MTLTLPSWPESLALVFTTVSIGLAARNSVHTWWTGIIGCVLFGWVYADARLYAETTLQLFFLVTSALGWWQWRQRSNGAVASRPVTRAPLLQLLGLLALAAVATVGYGALLHRLTDAYMPYWDAALLGLSVMAQCLLMQRRLETWPVWLLVNTLSVPLFWQRELHLTALLYVAYWLNAWHGWWHWRRLLPREATR